MEITGITIGGFKNIDLVTLEFPEQISALIGFNNYGKSNLLTGIAFGLQFIKESSEERKLMMHSQVNAPLRESLLNKPFVFALKFYYNSQHWHYSYSWHWRDSQISSEVLSRDNVVIHNRKQDTQVVPNLSLLIDKQNSSLAEVYQWLKSISTFGIDLLHNVTSGSVICQSANLSLAAAVYRLQTEDLSNFQLLTEAYCSLLPEIEWIKAINKDDNYSLQAKEKYIKDPTPFEYLSMGSRRLLALLFLAIKAESHQVLVFEEVETCLHPRLIPLLLISLSRLAKGSRIIITSHSPYLIQHLPLKSIYIATPQVAGVAGFKTINPALQNKLLLQAQELDISLGVYLFDLLIESLHEPELLKEWL